MSVVRVVFAAAVFGLAAGCSDGGGNSTTTPPANAPPVAQAGFDRAVGKRVLVSLDGSASYDPEGRPLALLWSFVSRPAASTATIYSSTSEVAGFEADVEGAYVVRLQVSDGFSTVEDQVTITSVNQPPIANAGVDRQGSRAVPLTLSGLGSRDPDGDLMTYAWTLVSVPVGSLASLGNPSTSATVLTPDLFGTYVVRLTVGDGQLTSFDDVSVTVANHAPVANAGPDLVSNAGATLTLSAGASTDPDLDPLTCTWTVVSTPDGSGLANAASCSPSATFSVEGTYVYSLSVSDGTLPGAAADTVQVTVGKHVWMLGLLVVDAEYSRPLDRIVAVSASANRLNLLDPATETATSVDLSLAPTSVSVSPDGTHAAVGHNGYVSYVHLSPAPLAVERVISTTADVLDVVLAGNGYAYAFPRTDQWETIRCLRVSDGAETLSTGYSIYAGTLAKLHPAGSAIYGANNGLSPSDIEKYTLGSGTAALAYDSPYHGDYSMCGDLWMSEDGLRIFTACGNTFHANTTRGTTAGSDMTFAGALESTTSVEWVDHSLLAGEVIAIPGASWYGSTTADTEMVAYDDAYLARSSTTVFPLIGVGGGGFSAHGRFAFFSGDGTSRYALVAVDATAGLLTPHAVIAY